MGMKHELGFFGRLLFKQTVGHFTMFYGYSSLTACTSRVPLSKTDPDGQSFRSYNPPQ